MSNFVWGPSFWDDNAAGSASGGNNAEKIPSYLRLIGYPKTATNYPTKIGVEMKMGSPFIKDLGKAPNNEIYCGSNFGALVKCYYYGNEKGLMIDQ